MESDSSRGHGLVGSDAGTHRRSKQLSRVLVVVGSIGAFGLTLDPALAVGVASIPRGISDLRRLSKHPVLAENRRRRTVILLFEVAAVLMRIGLTALGRMLIGIVILAACGALAGWRFNGEIRGIATAFCIFVGCSLLVSTAVAAGVGLSIAWRIKVWVGGEVNLAGRLLMSLLIPLLLPAVYVLPTVLTPLFERSIALGVGALLVVWLGLLPAWLWVILNAIYTQVVAREWGECWTVAERLR